MLLRSSWYEKIEISPSIQKYNLEIDAMKLPIQAF